MSAPGRWGLLVLPILLTGCSTFGRKWQHANQPGAPGSVSRWEGRWTSEHHRQLWGGPAGGRLRCILVESSNGGAQAEFHANWLCFAGDYAVSLQPAAGAAREKSAPSGSPREYSGAQPLPAIFGGLYRYRAQVTADRFSATYRSKYDAGTFEMTRQLTNPREFH